MKKVILISSLLLICYYIMAIGKGRNDPEITEAPDTKVKVHHGSNIYFTITNFGMLGSMDGSYSDPDWQGIAPGAEFPAASEKDYLFMGALWIGAEVDTVDQYGNPAIDTLASVGYDGWWGIWELFPPPAPEQSLWEQEIFGDEEFFAVYFDTLTDPQYVGHDPNDQRPHIPLGLRITQNSFCWSSTGYDEIFIINFVLENISLRNLHNVWLGVYYDGDVLHGSESPYGDEEGAGDDLCGFVEYNDSGIGWLADNDGQPYDGQYDSLSTADVMCLMLLGSTQPGLQTNFNWWISSIFSDLDWGPQLQSNFDRWGPFPGGGRGTPGGDNAKYQVMANGERDYDQIWAALDHTDEGWIAGVADSDDIANGFDTRYLISFGPMEISSGEIETVTVAYFGARNFHRIPSNYQDNLQHNTDDSLSIGQYYQNLDLSDILIKADSAKSYYSHDYANVPPGPPRDFRVDQWDESRITLKWNMTSYANLGEYRIYKGTEPGVYDPDKITPDGFIDTVFADTNIANNTRYYYVIASANTLGLQGSFSAEASINSGQPQTPSGLAATSGHVRIDLTWNENPDSDILGYIVFRAAPNSDFVRIDTVETNAFSDLNVHVGREYRYKITALDIYGNESFFSETVSILAMGLDSGILLVMSNRSDGNPDFDSMMVFYENAFRDYQYWLIDYRPDNMPLLASFSTVIFCKEHITGNNYFDIFDNDSLFANYLECGGKLLLAGTRQITPVNSFEGVFYFDPDDFVYRYLNIAGVDFPDIFNTEFIGGDGELAPFDDFAVDTSRANRIIFPPIDNEGRLPGIGTIIPNDSNEVIYDYVAVNPDTSSFHGRPIGLIHHAGIYNTAVMEFPLYYVQEPGSFEILHEILAELGETPVRIDNDGANLPIATQLFQNYPNPFNSTTLFDYLLKDPGYVSLSIYNILGQKVAILVDGVMDTGKHKAVWCADNVPSGIYFARLTSEKESGSIKLILMK